MGKFEEEIIRDELLLVHRSAQLKWDESGYIIWDYSKMQPLIPLTSEQRKEIRQLFPTASQQNLGFLSVILLIFLALIGFLVILTKNDEKKRKKKLS